MAKELNTLAQKKWVQNFAGATPTIDTTDGVSIGDTAYDNSTSPYTKYRCYDNTNGSSVWYKEEGGELTADKTLNYTTSDSAATINAGIAAVPRNLGGNTLTIQLADGTYTNTATILISGFYNGQVFLKGNVSNNTLSTSKSVIIDTASASVDAVNISYCTAKVAVYYCRINIGSTKTGVYVRVCTDTDILACYIINTSLTSGRGCYIIETPFTLIQNTYFSALATAIDVYRSRVLSTNNDDTGTQPQYGYKFTGAAYVGATGTKISGSIAQNATTDGSCTTAGL